MGVLKPLLETEIMPYHAYQHFRCSPLSKLIDPAVCPVVVVSQRHDRTATDKGLAFLVRGRRRVLLLHVFFRFFLTTHTRLGDSGRRGGDSGLTGSHEFLLDLSIG